MALTQESVLSFLLDRGGKVKNSELLSNFRSLIGGTDPAETQRNRDLFKRLVNSVAVVQQVDEAKFVVVRKRYQDFVREAAHDASRKSPTEDSVSCQNPNAVFARTPPHPPPPPHPAEPSGRTMHPDVENSNVRHPSDTRDESCGDAGSVRDRKSSSRDDGRDDDVTAVRVLNLSAEQTSGARRSGAVFAVIAVRSPPRDSSPAARGRSHTQVHQNKSPDKPTKLTAKVSAPSLPNLKSPACKKGAQNVRWESREAEETQLSAVRPPHKTTKQGDDVKNYADCVPLEPLAHEWLVKCAAGQWGHVHGLLLRDARVAQKKDFMSGFTALHWAAKDGNSKMIQKLMDTSTRGGVCLDVNSKAHGGYTPLHVAAIHGRNDVMVSLVQRYGASVSDRDNNGKRASHYLGRGAPAEVRALLGGLPRGESKEKGEEEEEEEYREPSRGLNSISKLFQPHIGKKQKLTTA